MPSTVSKEPLIILDQIQLSTSKQLVNTSALSEINFELQKEGQKRIDEISSNIGPLDLSEASVTNTISTIYSKLKKLAKQKRQWVPVSEINIDSCLEKAGKSVSKSINSVIVETELCSNESPSISNDAPPPFKKWTFQFDNAQPQTTNALKYKSK